jgi:lipopolysaccharide export system protein LptA
LLLASFTARADLDDVKDLNAGGKNKKDAIDDTNPGPDLGIKATPQPSPEKQSPSATPKPTTAPAKPRSSNAMRTRSDSDKEDRKKPIKWSATGLKASRDGKIVDLVNNVVVVQGNLRMTANKARVFFNRNDEVDRVEAEGDVKVNKVAQDPKDRVSARGNRAIFYNTERKVILTGRAALWRASDVVRGKQISYNLDSGWITVDNVEGVVQPGAENELK